MVSVSGLGRRVALLALVLACLAAATAACGKAIPAVGPERTAPAARPGAPGAPTYADTAAVPNEPPKPVDPSLITQGTRAALFSPQSVGPVTTVCTKEERRALTFEHAPTYTEKVDTNASFSARLFVGNTATCTRKVSIPLSFTPPKTTATRTIEFFAYVRPRGALVDLKLDAAELAEADVRPGRYAITFAVVDEEGQGVGRALSGNAFRLGRDDVALVSAPSLPARIGLAEDLVVPFAIENRGDTANRVTPLVVFTRPGETTGIEHYDPPVLAVPGASTYTLRLSQHAREAEKILPGSWLVTVTMFDAAGDRMNTFAGLPLTIGAIDVRMTRPELPSRVKASAALRTVFKLDNRGDTRDKVTAVVAFTKPGTTSSREFTFTRDVPPGTSAFETVIEPAARLEKGVDKGVWLVTTAAFRSSGERIKSFTGHYLEIAE
jgi:hypothetical protein